MKKNKIQNGIRKMILGLIALAFMGCSGYNTIIKMREVKDVPADSYERIIKLYNPGGSQDKTLAGLVFIRKGASVCTDYPREEIIKSVDELAMMEKDAYRYSSHYAIEAGGRTFGFVSVPVEYNVMLWENAKDENCQYKVQIISIDQERSDIDGGIPGVGPGGAHGGGPHR
ncbi:MAG: hypothetical protein WC373_01570 [Smithella sp.]|jgi:hypothetical protein